MQIVTLYIYKKKKKKAIKLYSFQLWHQIFWWVQLCENLITNTQKYVYILKLQINLDKWKLWHWCFFILFDAGNVRIIYCLLWSILSYLISENVVHYNLLKKPSFNNCASAHNFYCVLLTLQPGFKNNTTSVTKTTLTYKYRWTSIIWIQLLCELHICRYVCEYIE